MGMVLTDERWAALAPLLEACRPKGKTPPRDLRQTIAPIVWRHANGARWRAIPAEHGPWWRAAQLFIRGAKLGVWERLLAAAQEGGVELGMAFLDGTSIRAHPKAAGAPKKGDQRPTGPAGSARTVARGLRHQGVHRRRRARSSGRFRARPRPSARAAASAGAAGPPPEGATLGRRRSRLQLRRLPRAGLEQGGAAGDLDPEQRGGGRLPGLNLPQPQPRRAALGSAQGVAGRRHPLREDSGQLPRRALPRRHRRLAQALTGPSAAIPGEKVMVNGSAGRVARTVAMSMAIFPSREHARHVGSGDSP